MVFLDVSSGYRHICVMVMETCIDGGVDPVHVSYVRLRHVTRRGYRGCGE